MSVSNREKTSRDVYIVLSSYLFGLISFRPFFFDMFLDVMLDTFITVR